MADEDTGSSLSLNELEVPESRPSSQYIPSASSSSSTTTVLFLRSDTFSSSPLTNEYTNPIRSSSSTSSLLLPTLANDGWGGEDDASLPTIIDDTNSINTVIPLSSIAHGDPPTSVRASSSSSIPSSFPSTATHPTTTTYPRGFRYAPSSPSLQSTGSYPRQQQHTVSSSPSYVKPNYNSAITATTNNNSIPYPPSSSTASPSFQPTSSLLSSSSSSSATAPGSPTLTASRTTPYYPPRNRSGSRGPSIDPYPPQQHHRYSAKGETGIPSSSSRRHHSRSRSRGGQNWGQSTSLHYRRSLSIAQEEKLQQNTRRNQQPSSSSSANAYSPPPPPLLVNRAITVTRATRRLPSRSISVARGRLSLSHSHSVSFPRSSSIPSLEQHPIGDHDEDRLSSASYTEHSRSRSRSRLRSLPRDNIHREDKEISNALLISTDLEKSWQNVLTKARNLVQSSDNRVLSSPVSHTTAPPPLPLPTFPRTNLCTILPNGIILWPCYTYRKEKSGGKEQWRNHLRLAFTHTKEIQHFDNFMEYHPENNPDSYTASKASSSPSSSRWPFIRLIDIECIDEYGLRKSIPNTLLDGGSCIRLNHRGDHLSIVSAYGILVVRLPSFLCQPHAYEISIVTHSPTNILVPAIGTLIQPTIDHSLDGFTPVDARWHPVCHDYLTVLTIDSLRIFYIGNSNDPLIFRCVQEYSWDRASFRSPPSAFSFGSEKVENDLLTVTKNKTKDTKETASSSTVPNGVPLWSWNPLTVYITCADGSLYILCPVLPPNATVPLSYYRTLLHWSRTQDKEANMYRNVSHDSNGTVTNREPIPSATTLWLLRSFYIDGNAETKNEESKRTATTASTTNVTARTESVTYRPSIPFPTTNSSLSSSLPTVDSLSLPSSSSSLSAINYAVPVLRGPLTCFPSIPSNPYSIVVDIRIVPLSKRVINRSRTAFMLLFSDGKVVCMYCTAPITPTFITSLMMNNVGSMFASSTGNNSSITITNVPLRHHDVLRIRIPRPYETEASALSILVVDAVDLTITKKVERKLRKGTYDAEKDEKDKQHVIGWPVFVPLTRVLPSSGEDRTESETWKESIDDTDEEEIEEGFSTVILGSKVFALSHLWSQQTAVWVNAMRNGSTTPTLFVECLGDVRNYDTQRGWKAEWRTKSEYVESDRVPSILLPPEPPLVIAGVLNYTSLTSRGLIIATLRAGDIGIHSTVPEIMIKDIHATDATVKMNEEFIGTIAVKELCNYYELSVPSSTAISIGMLVQEPRTIDFAFYIQPLSSLFFAVPELGSQYSNNTILFDRYEALRTNPHLYGKDSVFMKKVKESSALFETVMKKFQQTVKENNSVDNGQKNISVKRPLTVSDIRDTSLAVHVASLFDENNIPLPMIDPIILQEEEELRRIMKEGQGKATDGPSTMNIPQISLTRIEHNQFADTVDTLLETINALADLETTNTHVWHYVREAGAHLEFRDFYPDLKEAINHLRYRTEALSLRAQHVVRNHELLRTRTETLLYTMGLLNPKLTHAEKRLHQQLKSIHESLSSSNGMHRLRLNRLKQQIEFRTKNDPTNSKNNNGSSNTATTKPILEPSVTNNTPSTATVGSTTAVSLLDLLKARTAVSTTGTPLTVSTPSSRTGNENRGNLFLENQRKEQTNQQLYQRANSIMDTAYTTRRYAEELQRRMAMILRG